MRRLRLRLQQYKTAACYRRMMAFRMSRQPRGRANPRRNRQEIKMPALPRRPRGLQRQRKQAQQREVWVWWKPNHPLRITLSMRNHSFWPSSTCRRRMYHQEQLGPTPLPCARQRRQKKNQHQQKARRELRHQRSAGFGDSCCREKTRSRRGARRRRRVAISDGRSDAYRSGGAVASPACQHRAAAGIE